MYTTSKMLRSVFQSTKPVDTHGKNHMPLSRCIWHGRTVRVVLAILRRSTQRMATARRSKFLEASLRPALEATKRVGLVAAAGDAPAEPGLPHKSGGSGDDEDPDDDGTSRERGEEPPPPLLATADGDMPSRAAYDAATSAAETAADFIGPLMEQASAERALLTVSGLPTAGRREGRPVEGATSAGGSTSGGRTVVSGEEKGVSASDLSLAAYIGFALSALELAGETSVCCTAAAAAAAAAATGSEDKAPAVQALTRAEQRLVEIVLDSPLDLRFVLLHGCRVSYAGRVKRRRRRRGEGGGEEGESHLPAAGLGGAVGLGEAAVSGALPWTLRGVSTFAYLVSELHEPDRGSARRRGLTMGMEVEGGGSCVPFACSWVPCSCQASESNRR